MPVAKKFISDVEMRRLYNAHVDPLVVSGACRIVPIVTYPAKVSYGFPQGAKSGSYSVVDQSGQMIAKVHCFSLPDGTILASGRLDPKELRIGDTHYLIAT